ncbi:MULTISPECIES: CvpA family protein [unclassified Enterococcus]|jgi:uncharacterized membrane protein required for colicin V production|uniref:CvpA family protein n=1 Tax=unclassified Enterococcus TaxID=2608891 RepID=UPI0003F4B562
MLTLLILFILLIAFFSGARRGFTMQAVFTVGYVISFIAAQHFYKPLANHLRLYIPYPAVTPDSQMAFFDQARSLSLDQAFYAGVAFLAIFAAGWLITRFIGVFLHGLTYVPVLRQADWIAGGILSMVVAYAVIFMLLSLLMMVPLDSIQNLFKSNGLPRFIVENTPVLSNKIYDLWITRIIG